MRHALRIFRKDVRHLWPRIAIVLAVELLLGWGFSSLPHGSTDARNFLGLFVILAGWYLIVAVIHEEAVPGNRQYWLTRPFSWRDLLAAKMIFILVFICLPGFAYDVITLVVRGKSPLVYLPEILVSQLFFLAKVILPVAALAAITADLVEAVGGLLAAYVGITLIMLPLLVLVAHTGIDWGGIDWLRTTVMVALLLAASASILLVQYARRRTWLSRGILVAALLILPFFICMPGWHTAFALQTWLSGQHVAGTVARIAFDPARNSRTRPQYGASWSPDVEGFSIPVRVTGIPDRMALYSDRATVTVATPDGRRWSSGWDSLNGLFRVIGTPKARREDEQLLPDDGEYWLYLNVDRSFFSRASSAPVHLHARMALTLLSSERVTPLTLREGAQAVSNDGFCWVTSRKREFETACSWPVRTPAHIGFRLRPDGTSLPPASSWGDKVGSYGPYPTSGGLWQDAGQTVTADTPPVGIDLVTRTAVAHFERDLDIPDLGEWTKK